MKRGLIEASLYDLNSTLIKRMLIKIPIPRTIQIENPAAHFDDEPAMLTFKLEAWNTEFALYVVDDVITMPEEMQ